MSEVEQLKHAIEALEAQRAMLGDAVVDAALGTLREKLRSLQPQISEQRKLVSVLFADLVGFTDLSTRLDAEDTREILNRYFKRWAECIEARRGLVEKFIGDAVMAVFGLPDAREDDPESAIRAALAMRAELSALNEELSAQYGVQLAMRVGIHTGPVVVSFLSERKGQDFVIVGDMVNLASRLQSAAPENGILISHDAYRHVRGLFVVQTRAPLQVKGISEPIQTYLVEYARQHAFRLQIRGVEGIETRIIGREEEIGNLQRAYQAAADGGMPQFVTVAGEAGIGKSRLLDEFVNWLELLPNLVSYFKGRASPAMQNQAYSLLRDLFSDRFRIQDSDPPLVVREKMEAGFRAAYPPQSGIPEEQVLRQAHMVGQLLGFDFSGSPYVSTTGPARQLRDQSLAILLAYFLTLASQNPVVLVLEDLHWADDSSLDAVSALAQSLAERQDSARLLLVGTTRPGLFERRPDWGAGLTIGSRLALNALTSQDSQRLVCEILQKVPDLPDELRELIVMNAEGNPFYIEELIKMLIEDGVILTAEDQWQIAEGRLEAVRVPPTLTGVLQARFDSLETEERGLLQHASVIGRIFWDEAVRQLDHAAPLPDPDSLTPLLTTLSRREMIFQHGASSFEDTLEYQFKHALLRDVTYESLLKRERRSYHARAARWLEQVTARSQRAEEYAARIAEHYDRAGESGAAAPWYRRAGQAATAQYANAETVRLLTRALELTPVGDLPARYEMLKERELAFDRIGSRPEQRQDLEEMLGAAAALDAVDLQAYVYMRQGGAVQAIGQFPEARALGAKAVELAEKTDDLALQAWANLALSTSTWLPGDYQGARPHLERALTLAQRAGAPDAEADALRQLGIVVEAADQYNEARGYFEQAYEIMHRLNNRRGESYALNSLGNTAYRMQDFRAALDYLERSLQIKLELGDRRILSTTYFNLGLTSYSLGDLMEARHYMHQTLMISRDIEDADTEGSALGGLGLVSLTLGEYERARQELDASIALYREIENPHDLSNTLAFRGLLSLRLGDPEEALRTLREALPAAEEAGMWDLLAHLRLFLGQALLDLGRAEEASAFYQQAIQMENAPPGNHMVYEAQAGLVRAALAGGERETARRLAGDLWTHLQSGSSAYEPLEGMVEPFLVYLSVYQGLSAAGDPRAAAVLARGGALLLERAGSLPNDSTRAAYLEAVPFQRELHELYTRLAAAGEEGTR